jgi:hypothetical protein
MSEFTAFFNNYDNCKGYSMRVDLHRFELLQLVVAASYERLHQPPEAAFLVEVPDGHASALETVVLEDSQQRVRVDPQLRSPTSTGAVLQFSDENAC